MPSEEKNRILVGYAWGFGNIGDAAITPGLLNLLYKHFPEYEMSVVTEGSRGRVAEYLEKHFTGCEVFDGRPLGNAYTTAMNRMREDFGGELPSINSGNIDYIFETFAQNCVDSIKRHNPEFMDVLRETKLMIYNSGMILVYGEGSLAGTDFWGYSLRRSLPLLIAKRLGIPYGIYAHSFDSFGGPGEYGFLYFSRLLEGASFVFCRDSDSLDYIERSDIRPRKMMFVPDSTFSFGRGDYEWAEQFMSAHDLKSRDFIVVIPRTICKLVDEETSKSHMKKLREIIERWVRKTGKKVVIAAEVRNDLPPARELVYNKLANDVKQHCVMMQEYWTAEQASGLYRSARILISMELHSPLLALPEGTPVIVPTFKESGRKIWMLRDFKLGEYMFDIDSASTEAIEESLYQIHENYGDISSRIQAEVIPYLREREERGMEVIGGILKNRRDK